MKIINSKIIDNFLNSRQTPAFLITILLEENRSIDTLRCLHTLSNHTISKFNFGSQFKKNIHTKIVAEFAEIIYNLLYEREFVLKEFPTVLPIPSKGKEKIFQLVIYSFFPRAVILLSNLIIKIINEKNSIISHQFKNLYNEQFIKRLENIDGLSRINKNFINAAYSMNMPFLKITSNILQFGWGKHGFQLGGTFTENTARNSVVMVRNKYLTSLLLKKAGFPVLDELLAKDIEQCKKFVKKFGFSIVLKPADKDAGQGIETNISNLKELSKAFIRCQKISKNVLIQKFSTGNDYRFTTLNGKVIWVYQRIKARVIGDGKSSISLLIKKENATPKRKFPYKEITIDDKANSLLKKQNLTLKSIPKKGEEITLGSISNTYNGALPVIIPPEKVHPDNKLLIERAANLFRLDITGIDFFSEDISKSWHDVEAHIMEINSCPDLSQTGPHLYDIILTQSVEGDGRIPSALIFSEKNLNLRNFISFCISNNKKVGIYTKNDIRINDMIIKKRAENSTNDFKILLMENSIDFLVMIVEKKTPFKFTSLPIDRFDCLCIESSLSPSESLDLNWLKKSIAFDFSKNKRIKTPMFIGSEKVINSYNNINNYLIENFSNFENFHNNKFHAIKDPLNL